LVGVYARYYMSPDDPLSRFFALLLAFMGAMLGIVMSGNVIQLVFFWELTSLFSFLLIGYWHHGASARDGARMALIVTCGGGLCLFAGMMLRGHIVGSYGLDSSLAAGALGRAHARSEPALGQGAPRARTKGAQSRCDSGRPRAMPPPTPVPAHLRSASMGEAGVRPLVRFWRVLAAAGQWEWLGGGAGTLTRRR